MNTPEGNTSPIIQVAREQADGDTSEVLLSTGYRARIVPVGATLIDEVTKRVEDPVVPVIMDDAKGREIENPNDPAYLRELKRAENRRATAAMDAMVMFGMELLDGLPEDDSWLAKLRFLERRGQLDLSGFDVGDPLDREFIFKRYIACGTVDLIAIGRKAGLRQEDVAAAARGFQGEQARVPDRDGGAET